MFHCTVKCEYHYGFIADCLQILLEYGADPNDIGPGKATPVVLAAAEGHHQ